MTTAAKLPKFTTAAAAKAGAIFTAIGALFVAGADWKNPAVLLPVLTGLLGAFSDTKPATK